MTVTSSILAFTATAALMTMTPGLDTALVLRTAATEGPRRAILASLGIGCGVLIWGAAAAIGLGALLAASTLAYTVLRWAGAAYLFYLGYGMLRHPRAVFDAGTARAGNAPARLSENWFLRGMLTNLLNPKVGVFYVTFLPQFVPPTYAHPAALMLLFAAIHGVEGVSWFATLTAATKALSRVLQRPGVVTRLDRLTGMVLIAFAAKLCFTV